MIFEGDWRITEMELWDKDVFDMLGPAYFSFDKHSMGSFRFIVVEGSMDCKCSEKDGKPFMEFSWIGDDDGRMKNGRGWACIENDGTLTGRFFFHQGDDSWFKARKSEEPLKSAFRPGPLRRRRR